jgi:hypothetical protein
MSRSMSSAPRSSSPRTAGVPSYLRPGHRGVPRRNPPGRLPRPRRSPRHQRHRPPRRYRPRRGPGPLLPHGHDRPAQRAGRRPHLGRPKVRRRQQPRCIRRSDRNLLARGARAAQRSAAAPDHRLQEGRRATHRAQSPRQRRPAVRDPDRTIWGPRRPCGTTSTTSPAAGRRPTASSQTPWRRSPPACGSTSCPDARTAPATTPYLDTTRLARTGFAPTVDVATAVADYVVWRADNPR